MVGVRHAGGLVPASRLPFQIALGEVSGVGEGVAEHEQLVRRLVGAVVDPAAAAAAAVAVVVAVAPPGLRTRGCAREMRNNNNAREVKLEREIDQ